ncbi:hypothetical protein SLA_6803 [Streptomyces laurentii]|uniref:Uncharacterized protein n=1 Tax=Streptomyces laurentii TaxID=39478 RepID=A0A160P6Z9_STRLU|nr:hypothetical protein SLA_6803 [Streptomyces laurentii]
MSSGTPMSPIPFAPAGLSRRARSLVKADGIRLPRQDLRRDRAAWLAHGISATEINRAAAGLRRRTAVGPP